MAIIKCKECNKEISNKANSCPHCGFVYKKQKSNTKKIILISFITVVLVIGLAIGIYTLIVSVIPDMKVKHEMQKYYGLWELVDDNYGELINNYLNKDYTLKKEIKIDENNIESQTGSWGCGFNMPKVDFAITTSENMSCDNDYYLIASLNAITEEKINGEDNYNPMLCFNLKDDMLVQKECSDITISNIGIKYKRK